MSKLRQAYIDEKEKEKLSYHNRNVNLDYMPGTFLVGAWNPSSPGWLFLPGGEREYFKSDQEAQDLCEQLGITFKREML